MELAKFVFFLIKQHFHGVDWNGICLDRSHKYSQIKKLIKRTHNIFKNQIGWNSYGILNWLMEYSMQIFENDNIN